MRALSLLSFLVIFLSPSVGLAQADSVVREVTEHFTEACNAAISDPSGYIARAGGKATGAAVKVTQDADGTVYYISESAPPREFALRFMQGPGTVFVSCHGAAVGVPSLLDSAAVDAAFTRMLVERGARYKPGGALDLKNLLAGDNTGAGQVMQGTPQIYRYLFTTSPNPNLIISATIQANLFELIAFAAVNQTLPPAP